ncbi:Hypothetical protein PHPALM_20618, partial [Phytophthora palmivora]
MTEWIDPKEFKRLWRALVKAGWKARPPSVDTEQAGGMDATVPADTEQGDDMEDSVATNTDQDTAVLTNAEISLDAFDSPHFIDAMRAKRLFGPVDADDVNISENLLVPEEEVESVSDPVDAPVDLSDSFESKVESDDEFEDGSSEFAQDDMAMRAMAATGWEKRWYHIAKESEAYRIKCIPSVPAAQHAKQIEALAKDPTKKVQSLEVLIEKLTKTRSIKAHEILYIVGLLIARSLCGHTDGLDKHWRTEGDGAIPRGTFSRYMTRDRFTTILRYLHFQSSSVEVPTTDRAWKVRPVLQTLERAFRRGYRLGSRISFDEGTIPNRSKFNPVRVYNKDKPHKYGTKVYMTCCAESGYCSLIEVYLGASDEAKNAKTPAERETSKEKAKDVAQNAAIRNITKALDGQPGKRLIVADNFYSSCALAIALLERGYYY